MNRKVDRAIYRAKVRAKALKQNEPKVKAIKRSIKEGNDNG